MLTPIEAAWLAGFIDADGCIRLSKGFKNEKKDQHSLIPQVTVHNTCVVTLNRVAALVERVIGSTKTSARKRISVKHSKMYNVEVMGMKRCEPLLRVLLPHLVTKRLEAELLLQFIGRRKTIGIRNKPYGPVDYKVNEALKHIKKTRHLRDYVPTVEEILDQDIVRTNAKALEVAEMATRLSQDQLKQRASKLVWYRWDRSQAIGKIAK